VNAQPAAKRGTAETGASDARSAAAAASKPQRPPLISEITVGHGPADLLGRFFLKADTAARNRGLTLYFGTFEELLGVNSRNQETWKPITSMYDHRCCPQGLAADRAFCILGRDQEGEVVATQASRLFESTDADTLHDIATSSRMFYDDPQRTKNPDERCEVTAAIARSIRGRIGLNGAVWYHPTFRKRQLAMIIPRITRAYAYTRWKIDYSMGLAMEGPAKGGVIDRVGYPHREWDLRLYNAPNGNPRCCFGWMTAEELLADLGDFLLGFDAQVDVRVGRARAQQQG
jgi:hypothetical protein